MNSQEIIFFAPLHFTENICQKHAVLGISRWRCHKGHSYLSQVSENRSRFQRGLQLNIFPFFQTSGFFCDRAKQMSVIFPARQKQHIFTHNGHRTMAGTHTETILSRLALSVKWLKWWLKQINLSLCCSSPYNFWLTSRLAIPHNNTRVETFLCTFQSDCKVSAFKETSHACSKRLPRRRPGSRSAPPRHQPSPSANTVLSQMERNVAWPSFLKQVSQPCRQADLLPISSWL